MGRKKKQTVTFDATALTEPFVPAEIAEESYAETPVEKIPRRITIALDGNGNIDKSRLSSDDLVLMMDAIDDGEKKEKKDDLTLGDDEANMLLDVVGGICATGAAKIYKVPKEITSQAYTFTEFHRKKINPKLIVVLNKWGPEIIKRWKDEIGLAIVFGSVLNAQTKTMHMLENQRKSKANRPSVVPTPKTNGAEVHTSA